MRVSGNNGRKYELQKEIASGGEGKIYELQGNILWVAKIYDPKILSAELEKKITYMVNHPPSKRILSQVAWPLEVLYDENGYFCGFLMPKLNSAVTLQAFYEYPQTQYQNMPVKYKVIVAQNICAVLSDLHAAGYVFGDFNPANIGVNPKTGEIAFFDMDTCHFKDKITGHVYRCMGGCDGYVAPELLEKVRRENKSFGEASLPTFTEMTDAYSLAIHIFKLLMNGITPYADGYRFDKVMVHPPALPHKDTLPTELHALFSKACNNKGYNRPSANEWHAALIRFERNLTGCSKNPVHNYRAALSFCPYCETDARYQDILKRCGFKGSQVTPQPRITQRIIPTGNIPQGTITSGNPYHTGSYPGNTGSSKWWLALLAVVCSLAAVFISKEVFWQEEKEPVQSVPAVYVTQPEVYVTEEEVIQEAGAQQTEQALTQKEKVKLPICITSNTFSGTLNYRDEIDTYLYTAPTDGVYYLECEISDADNGYYVYVWTEDQKRVGSEFYRSGVTVELEAGTRYYIEVRTGSIKETFSYSVKIGVPQAIKYVNGNSIHGEFEYTHQENWYIFNPAETGDYILEAQISNPEDSFLYMIFGSDKKCLESGNQSEILYEELTAGETYYIKVLQFKGYPNYDISISKKATE